MAESEITLWAQQQVRANIIVEASAIGRRTWRRVGRGRVPRRLGGARGQGAAGDQLHLGSPGKVATLQSVPRDPRDAERLGVLWRPGSPPERPKN